MSDTIQANGQHEVEAMDIPDAGYASTPEEIAEQMERAAEALGEDVEPDHEAAESEAEETGPTEEELEADLISIATEKAMQELFAVQDRLEAATEDHAEKAEIAKTAKKRVESLQEDLSFATKRLREARMRSEPDALRYPLLDGPKAEINARFSKPDAIQPIPADDFAEAYRRLARDTKLADLDIPKRAVTAMAKAGYVTVADVGKLTEASAPLSSVKGIGEDAAEQIIHAITDVSLAWKTTWDLDHPDIALNPAEAVVEGEEGDE